LSEKGNIAEVITRVNELLGQFVEIRRKRLQKQQELNSKVKEIQDEYGPGIDELKRREDDLFNQLVDRLTPRFSELARKGTKTIYLRNGEIRKKTSGKDKLDFAEGFSEERILKQIKRLGGLRRFTRIKRTIDKEALKKDPEFLSRLKGLVVTRKVSLVIKPAGVQGEEIVRDTDPLIVPFQQD
jgi:phage host-nuclease inhibitor protein Gam